MLAQGLKEVVEQHNQFKSFEYYLDWQLQNLNDINAVKQMLMQYCPSYQAVENFNHVQRDIIVICLEKLYQL